MERAAELLKDSEDFGGAVADFFETGRWVKVCFSCHQCARCDLSERIHNYPMKKIFDAINRGYTSPTPDPAGIKTRREP